jgi:hypothetical protein
LPTLANEPLGRCVSEKLNLTDDDPGPPRGESQAGLGAERSGRRSAIFEPIESANVIAEITAMPVGFLIIVLTAAAGFLLIVNLPIRFLPYDLREDGLFMRLAADRASGVWPGDFNQFTFLNENDELEKVGLALLYPAY